MLNTLNLLLGRAYARARREEGQGMAEYAIILTVIAVVVAGVLVLLAGGIGAALDKVTDIFPAPAA